MNQLQDRLSTYKFSTPSCWREKAVERQANKEWLRYSKFIPYCLDLWARNSLSRYIAIFRHLR